MANKNYVVLTPLKRQAKRGEDPTFAPINSTVSMAEDAAVPLVACGALRLSDVNDPAPPASEDSPA